MVQAVGFMKRFKTFSTPKAIVYVPLLPAVATWQMLWRGKQEAEHKQFNPNNHVNPVKKMYLKDLRY